MRQILLLEPARAILDAQEKSPCLRSHREVVFALRLGAIQHFHTEDPVLSKEITQAQRPSLLPNSIGRTLCGPLILCLAEFELWRESVISALKYFPRRQPMALQGA